MQPDTLGGGAIGGGADRRTAERLFHRDLPGGGYVAIDVTGTSVSSEPGQDASSLRVVVERRGDRQRREGHRPPVIREQRWQAVTEREFTDLFRLASDNAAIARELMSLRSRTR